MGWLRVFLAALVVAVSLALATPALAQEDPDPAGVTILDDGEDAQPESAVVRDDDTSATVRRIRRDLVIIAGAMTVAVAVYIWHTSPSRRVRIATQRAEVILDEPDEPDPRPSGD